MYGLYNQQSEGQQLNHEYNPMSVVPNAMVTGAKAGLYMGTAAGVTKIASEFAYSRLKESVLSPMSEKNSFLGEMSEKFIKAAEKTGKDFRKGLFKKSSSDFLRGYVHFGEGFLSTKVAKSILRTRVGGSSLRRSAYDFLYTKPTSGIPTIDDAISGRIGKFGETSAMKYISPGIGLVFAGMNIEGAVASEGKVFGATIGLGQELGASLGSSAGRFAGGTIGSLIGGAPGGYIGQTLGMIAGGIAGYQLMPTVYKMAQAVRQWGTPETGGNFFDNQYTSTMRQRSMLAIRTSQMNLRSDFGREAQILMGAMY